MSELHACPDCLRRSWLLSLLGPFLEKAATGSIGRRPLDLLQLSSEELVDIVAPNAGPTMMSQLAMRGESWFAERLEEVGCWSICRHVDAYPIGLRDEPGAPRALIGRGEQTLLKEIEPDVAVAIVGSLRATSYGREVARDLAADLAAAGMVVVSGLAFGIDACAHRGSLGAGTRLPGGSRAPAASPRQPRRSRR